ncbi:MAG: hypothetical protein KAS49_01850 [Candidatus Cloacimonetes bacterium]|nr:hypothetical protein [Candidatus Cloacimonadota bacterium]
MKKHLKLSILLLIVGLVLVGCSNDSTGPKKEAQLELVKASIEVLDTDAFQYEISFTLQNTGTAKAVNIEGQFGIKFENETEYIWSDWESLDFDLSAGSNYTETTVDSEENEEDFNLLLESEIYIQFRWETE